MLNCGVVFSHPLHSLDPAPTNCFPVPNVKSNFRWRFHNVENLKKKVTCELNILPVFAWRLFHATSRKKYVAVKGDYLERKKKTVFFLFYVCLPHSINLRTVLPCIFYYMLQEDATKMASAGSIGTLGTLLVSEFVSYICINNSSFIRLKKFSHQRSQNNLVPKFLHTINIYCLLSFWCFFLLRLFLA